MVVIHTTGMDGTVILTGEETKFMYNRSIMDNASNIIHIDEVGAITLVKISDKDCFVKKNKTILGI